MTMQNTEVKEYLGATHSFPSYNFYLGLSQEWDSPGLAVPGLLVTIPDTLR